MTARRETKWERVRDALRFTALPNWKLIPLLVVLAGVGYLLAQQMRARAGRPLVTREARIIRFGTIGTGRFGDPLVVVIGLPDGTTTQISPGLQQVANCRVGDRITYTSGPDGIRVDRCALPPLEIRN